MRWLRIGLHWEKNPAEIEGDRHTQGLDSIDPLDSLSIVSGRLAPVIPTIYANVVVLAMAFVLCHSSAPRPRRTICLSVYRRGMPCLSHAGNSPEHAFILGPRDCHATLTHFDPQSI